MRDLWRGEPRTLAEFAGRLTGSSDLYQDDGRRPLASINFTTCHDGFTLHDLVSYNDKRNDANGEGNRDGESHNRSWNCGAEGESDDPEVLELRARQMRNFIATLMLSQGVPMLSHGDEFARTQHGNNNAYCQDNEISWVDWSLLEDPGWRGLTELTARVLRLRHTHPVLRRRAFFSGRPQAADGLRDLAWFTPRGEEMTAQDWYAPAATLGLFLSGRDIPGRDARGEQIVDDSFLAILHAADRLARLPAAGRALGRRLLPRPRHLPGGPVGGARHGPRGRHGTEGAGALGAAPPGDGLTDRRGGRADGRTGGRTGGRADGPSTRADRADRAAWDSRAAWAVRAARPCSAEHGRPGHEGPDGRKNPVGDVSGET